MVIIFLLVMINNKNLNLSTTIFRISLDSSICHSELLLLIILIDLLNSLYSKLDIPPVLSKISKFPWNSLISLIILPSETISSKDLPTNCVKEFGSLLER